MNRQEYCVGFVFDVARRNVLLIRKNRPQWQAGLLNGIGGKVELGESAAMAMAREFNEEAGLELCGWEHVATELGARYRLDVYAITDDEAFIRATPKTDELLERVSLADFAGRQDVLDNLRMHVAIALDQSGVVKPVTLVGNAPG